MLTLIHGNDNLSSRKFFLEQKTKDSITFDSESLIIEDLFQSVQGLNLFEASKRVFIENLFTKKGSKNLEDISSFLEENKSGLEVFIWADKELTKTQTSSLPPHELKLFKIPSNIFGFLDNIRPTSIQNVNSFRQVIQETEVEIVFAMLVRQFRLLISVSENGENIDEVKRLAPWQKSKLIKQASLFSQGKLKKIYQKIGQIDKDQKTGGSALTLAQNIDILLLEI